MARKPASALVTRAKSNNPDTNGAVNASYPSSADTVTDDDTQMSNGYAADTPKSFSIDDSALAALESLSREPNKLFEAINQIALLGVENQTLELPKIIVIGDQSAGKSSAVAAISGISVPRKAGVCTRCPCHINLHRSKDREYSWIVSLEKKFCFPKGRWEALNEPTLHELARPASLGELAAVLYRAQRTVLNPGIDPAIIMGSEDEDLPAKDQAEFSPNLVRLDITGPNCANLSLYDLPGIFNQTARQDQRHLVREVQDLVMEYVKPGNNIILLACAMENDMENSTAASMVGNARHRCIGLLTKADRLPEGNPLSSWLAVLQGTNFRLGYGYFVTKQPNQMELDRGIDHSRARDLEDQFFKHQLPWNTHFAGFRNRFGIPNLQAALEEILLTHTRRSIPGLRVKIVDRLDGINARLQKLPEPPGDRSFSIVNQIVAELRSQLDQHMKGELPCNKFLNAWLYETCEQFKAELYQMRPKLDYRTEAERNEKAELTAMLESRLSQHDSDAMQEDKQCIAIDVDEEPPTTPARKRQASSMLITPRKKPRADTSFSSSTPSEKDLSITIEDVRNIRRQMNTSAVIGTQDHRAGEFLIIEALQNWRKPLEHFVLTSTARLKSLVINELAGKLLVPWETTLLSTEVPRIIDGYITEISTSHHGFAMHLLAAEQLQPTSLSQAAVKSNQMSETKLFYDARRRWRANLFLDREEMKKGKVTQGNEREEKLKRVTDEQLGSDEFADEIETMGRVRGYYNVASASLVDTMTKFQRLDLFEQTKRNLADLIQEKLGLLDAKGFEHCQRLLEEDPERAEQRKELKKQRAKFMSAKATLDDLFVPRQDALFVSRQ